MITIEVGKYTYQFDGEYWYRMSQDGSKLGDPSRREIALLSEIMSLQKKVGDLRIELMEVRK